MKSHWILLAAFACAGAAVAQQPMDGVQRSPFGPRKAAHGGATPIPHAAVQLLANGSDSCSTPDVIVGTGIFPFDNSTATSGAEGQLNSNCIFTNQQGIANDVWFSWTAPSTGRVELSTCAQTPVDTKIAVYAGTACPPVGGFTPLACNDDISSSNLQSKCFFDVVAAQSYLIQLGNFPGAGTLGGGGTFTLDYGLQPGPTPCQWDDGSPEITWSRGAAGAEMCWLQRFGHPGDLTQVSAIDVAFGAAFLPAQGTPNGLVNGAGAKVALWEDPNDDGDPSDLVLVELVNTTVANVDTNIQNSVPLTSTHTMNGVYFVGAAVVRPNPSPANFFPIPMDGNGCAYAPRLAWRASSAAGAFNFANVAANNDPPVAYSDTGTAAINLDYFGTLLLRPECTQVSNGDAFCFGDGADVSHTTGCPCANNGSAGHGCANSVNAAGALLGASGVTNQDTVALHGSGMPTTVACIYLQGDGAADIVFGDGVRCTGGTLLRLRTKTNVGGASSFPDSVETITLSARGGVTVGSGVTRMYQTYYRNSAAAFCPPQTFNVTNGWVITW